MALWIFLIPVLPAANAMELLEADLEIQVMKFTTVYNTDVSPDFLQLILAFRACAESFIRRTKNPQDILNTIINSKLELN